MAKLTKAQRAYLEAIPDWSAPYEVRERTGRKSPARVLHRLIRFGWAEYGPANNTYRITPAGRAVLADGEKDQ